MRAAGCLLAMVLFPGLLGADTKLVVTATDLPPLGSPSLEGNGVLGRFVSEAFQGKNYLVSYEYLPFARIVTSLEANTVPAAFFNRFQANERDYHVIPILRSQVVFFYKKGRFPQGLSFQDLKELGKYRIGIVRGAPTIGALEEAGIVPDLAADEAQDFRKLQNDRVDLVSTVDIFGWYALKELNANRDEYGVTSPLFLVESCLLVSRTLPEARRITEDFRTGFEAAKKSGRLRSILESVYGPLVPEYAVP